MININQGQDLNQQAGKIIKNIKDPIDQGQELNLLKEKNIKEIAEKNIIKDRILVHLHQIDIIGEKTKKKKGKNIEAEVKAILRNLKHPLKLERLIMINTRNQKNSKILKKMKRKRIMEKLK